MNLFLETARVRIFRAPEHGGDSVSGGGHPDDKPIPASEPVNDAFGQNERGHGNTPGVGVPGSQTNPVDVSEDRIAQRAQQLWEEEGRPDGRADDHWRRAEEELRRSGSPRVD